jgi:NADPH-dependent curcumin reductase CurA
MTEVNRRIVLAERPQGRPAARHFRLEQAPVPQPGAGELLSRPLYLSLDPDLRGRLSDGPSYTPPVAIGAVMTAGTVGQVVTSNIEGFAPGDFVVGQGGWQDFAVFKPGEVRKVDPALGPISTALGVLGMPGMTAYTGLHEIGRPQAGETLVVAAASGAVGAVVGQIARIKGCRVVGVAGSKDKCDYVVNELGFDACLDHRAPGFAEALAEACPKGIDVYWENVGGAVFDAVLPLLNPFARIPVCGLIARYNATELPEGPDRMPLLFRNVLTKRLTVRGFIVWDFRALEDQFRRDVGQWLREGKMRYREDVRDGLEQAPDAFMGLLEGGNFGKLLVRVAPDPTA